MPKRRKGGHEAGLELESGGMMRWLLTYADMITLLLALFVILYALASAQNKVVLQEMMAQFRAVFGPIPGNTTILPSQSSNAGEHYKIIPGEPQEGGPGGEKVGGMEKKITEKLHQQLGANKVSIRKEARGLVISILTDKVLFDLGHVHIKSGMKSVLDDVADVI
jgi:chemotaxis protein MotB